MAGALTSLAKAGSQQVQTSSVVITGNTPVSTSDLSRGSDQASNPAPDIYDVSMAGNGLDGSRWANPFTNLQDALTVVFSPAEIRFAKGVYYPDVGSGQVDNEHTSTFVMTDGVTLIGGFNFGDTDIAY